jgi:hypothetical protein
MRVSPWNLLLESLHSSMVDELIERAPARKPELGLPRRENGLLWPNPVFAELQVWKIDLGGESGWVFLGMDETARKRASCEPEKLWEGLLSRARKLEFPRRKLAPVFHSAQVLRGNHPIDHPKPARVIWIPFSLLPGQVCLGVGL